MPAQPRPAHRAHRGRRDPHLAPHRRRDRTEERLVDRAARPLGRTGWYRGELRLLDGFILPNGAQRSPDAAWIALSRWQALAAEVRAKFPPLCPDFVVELRSRTDDLAELQAKMDDYRACGARLGWLIDPTARRVYVYRPDRAVEVLDAPATLSGEAVLRGFTMDLTRIW